jgi:hypothetical protein
MTRIDGMVIRGFPTRMLKVEIASVAGAVANLTERGAVDPVITAILTLSDSGFVAVRDAVAYAELKDGSLDRGTQDGDERVEEAPKDTSWEHGEWCYPVLREFRILIENPTRY